MKKILDYPSGPVFVQGQWSTVRVKLWHGKRSKNADLTAQAARRFALTLLLEAEKLEASAYHGLRAPKTLARSIDRAVDALARFDRSDVKLRKRAKNRADREYFRDRERKAKA